MRCLLAMSTEIALRTEAQRLVDELQRLIQTLDPATFRAELEASARELLSQIRARVQNALAAVEKGPCDLLPGLRDRLLALKRLVEEFDLNVDWRNLFRRIQPAYAGLVAALPAPEQAARARLRPTNHVRSIVHVGFGFGALTLLHVLTRSQIIWIAGGFAAFALIAETSRRFSSSANSALMKLFAPIAHPHEHHRVNSASWYTAALLLLAVFAPVEAAGAGVIVLGLADPSAAFVGRRWGRTKLRDSRSLEGSATFALVGFVVSFIMLSALHTSIGTGVALSLALVAGVSGAVAELYSGRLDDNFTIPVSVAALVGLAMALIGA